MALLRFLAALVVCSSIGIAYQPNMFEGRELLKRFRRRAIPIVKHEITEDQRNLIVDKHNEFRRTVEPSAADMLYMSWDEKLEGLAQEYSRKCVYEHNAERSANKSVGFTYIGENLYVSTGQKIDIGTYATNAVVSWDKEREFYNYLSGSCQAGKACGHYTQNVWAQSYKVGCGLTTCDTIEVYGNEWKNATILVCNYGPGGNIRGQKPYQSGVACSKCPVGDTCGNKLCTNATRDPGYTGSGTSMYTRSPPMWGGYLLLLCTIMHISPAILCN